MAVVYTVATVDTTTPDGGLSQVLESCKVNPLIVTQIQKEGVDDLSDFSSMFTQSGYEDEAKTFRDKVEELKTLDMQIDVARIRKAILMARSVLNRAPPTKEAPTPEPADIESPLAVKDSETIQAAWDSRYNIALTMFLAPADPLVSRLYREFRSVTPTLIAVERVKSVYMSNDANPAKRVALAGGLLSFTVEGQEDTEVVNSVASYYFALRILANASAKAGNYQVESKKEKGTKVIFAPLDTNLDYADMAFRMALKQNLGSWDTLKWIEERDRHCRGLMLISMRMGWAQGEALEKAQHDTQIRWSPPASHPGRGDGGKRGRSPTRTTLKNATKKRKVGQTQQRTLQAQKGSGKGGGNAPWTGGNATKYANLAKGGKQICRAFNDGNCRGDVCPGGRIHVCSVVQNGKACGGKHPASRHQNGGKGR